MMCPRSSTISENAIVRESSPTNDRSGSARARNRPGSLRTMDAVILDVGGVLLVPHYQVVGPVFAPFGITLDEPLAERAHYFGIHALDAAADDERAARHAYLVGYAESVGVPFQHREAAIQRMRQAWSQPNLDVWQQHVRGSLQGLRRLAEIGLKLGIISNADGTIEEQLKRGQICQVEIGRAHV